MSSKQVTLGGEEADPRDGKIECPLCGKDNISETQLPEHISSDECQTDAKEIHYGNR